MTMYIRGLIKPVTAVPYISTRKDSGFKSVSLDVAESEDKALISSPQQAFQQLELLACLAAGAAAKLPEIWTFPTSG